MVKRRAAATVAITEDNASGNSQEERDGQVWTCSNCAQEVDNIEMIFPGFLLENKASGGTTEISVLEAVTKIFNIKLDESSIRMSTWGTRIRICSICAAYLADMYRSYQEFLQLCAAKSEIYEIIKLSLQVQVNLTAAHARSIFGFPDAGESRVSEELSERDNSERLSESTSPERGRISKRILLRGEKKYNRYKLDEFVMTPSRRRRSAPAQQNSDTQTPTVLARLVTPSSAQQMSNNREKMKPTWNGFSRFSTKSTPIPSPGRIPEKMSPSKNMSTSPTKLVARKGITKRRLMIPGVIQPSNIARYHNKRRTIKVKTSANKKVVRKLSNGSSTSSSVSPRKRSKMNGLQNSVGGSNQSNGLESNGKEGSPISEVERTFQGFHCLNCGVVEPRQERMVKHLITVHIFAEELATSICNQATKNLEERQKRENERLSLIQNGMKQEKSQLGCDICVKQFDSTEALQIHMKNDHFHLKPFACAAPNCGLTFALQYTLTRHMKKHSLTETGTQVLHPDVSDIKKKNYPIERHGFPPRAFTANKKISVTRKSASTPQVLEASNDKRKLAVFPRRVLETKKKVLPVDKSSIVKLQKKRYKCHLCVGSYNTAHQLREHILRHGTARPFNCDECVKAFKTQSNLRKHKSDCHHKQAIICTICKHNYSVKRNLVHHLIVAHDLTPERAKIYARVADSKSMVIKKIVLKSGAVKAKRNVRGKFNKSKIKV